jgi:hypothetical protein
MSVINFLSQPRVTASLLGVALVGQLSFWVWIKRDVEDMRAHRGKYTLTSDADWAKRMALPPKTADE